MQTSPSFFRRSCLVALAAGTLAGGLLLQPSSSEACGGLFCNGIFLQPVQQNAERILFEPHDNGTISTTVEITYAGEPQDFSWVVPVPDTPSLGVVDPGTLVSLDGATAPSIVPPPFTCTQPPSPMIPFGASADSMSMRAPAMDDLENGVDVEDIPQVGPYDPTVVSSEDPAALINWLNDNDYLITPEMEPAVAHYVQAGMKFLAMKLAPEAETSQIAPLRMTYPGTDPMVPIVLTGVGAEPEMGILVFIAGDSRYESSNFTNLEVDIDTVHAHPTNGQNNYYPLVSHLLDGVQGRGVVVEHVEGSPTVAGFVANGTAGNPPRPDLAVREGKNSRYLARVLDRNAVITRLYTRMSPWEMDGDPRFQPVDGPLKGNVFDLSDRPTIELCDSSATMDFNPVPCGSTYCGLDAQCATTETGIDGCVCPEGEVVRSITAPTLAGALAPAPTCQPLAYDMLRSVYQEDADTSSTSPECAAVDCGEGGECLVVSGQATCSCDEGYAGIVLFDGTLTCSPSVTLYDAEQLVDWDSPVGGCDGCSASGSTGGSGLAWLLVLGGGFTLGARRRRS